MADDQMPDVAGAAQDAAEEAKGAAQDVVDQVKDMAEDLADQVKDAASDALGGGDDAPPDEPPPPPAPPDVGGAAPAGSDRSSAASDAASLPDPVGELRFQVLIDDAVIGAFAECTGLSVEYEIFEYAEGGEQRFVHKFRGGLKYPNLVLKRGVTYEDALVKWFLDRRTASSAGTSPSTSSATTAKQVRTWSFAGLPRQVVGPVVQREVDERRDRDPRDRPPGLRGRSR